MPRTLFTLLALPCLAVMALSACGSAPAVSNADARSAFEAGEFRMAQARLGEIFAAGADNAETQRIKLDLMLETADGYGAMAAIEALPADALSGDERRIAMAHALILQGKAAAAGELYAEIEAEDFDEQDFRMVLWLLDELGEAEEFDAGIEAALEAFPQSADLNAMAARALIARDEPDEARPFANAAIGADPEHYEALLIMGELAILDGELDTAVSVYSRAAARYPDRAIPLANIAGLQLDLGQTKAAGDVLARALAAHPDDPFLQWQLARHALATDDLDTARRALETARRSYRGNDEFTLLSARAEERFGNASLALAEYRRYLRAVGEDEAVEARIIALEAAQ
ncbi:MAG: tetratricopeptide repeat protein [Pseudomonadota bacterium]